MRKLWRALTSEANLPLVPILVIVALSVTLSIQVLGDTAHEDDPVRLCRTASEDAPLPACHLDYRPSPDGGGDWWYVP